MAETFGQCSVMVKIGQPQIAHQSSAGETEKTVF
jgi:hypothetical protein